MNARGLVRTVALSVFVALAVSVAVASAATVRPGSEAPLCAATGNQLVPAIFGDRVVWTDHRYGAGDIYVKNLSTGAELPVCADSSNQLTPDIFGDTVVWADARNTNYDIYTRNLSTGDESPVCTVSEAQLEPAIFGDIVVWEDYRSATTNGSDIYMKDLSTGVESPVCTAPGNQQDPDVFGDIVVWEDFRNGTLDIYMKDLSTMDESVVCSGASWSYYPAVFEDTVVWTDDRNLPIATDIYMKDLSTGVESVVCAEPEQQDRSAIYGDLVVWQDRRTFVVLGDDIYMRDLVNGTESSLSTSNDDQCAPALYGHIAVWDDDRNSATGVTDIYSARIDGPVTRAIALEGRTRYETAAAASEDAYRSKVPVDREGYRTVVIATGENFPDALGASSLAGVLDAPVLIAKRDDLPAAVAAEVKRLGAKRAILVGGSDVVAAGVVSDLQALGMTKIERVAGATRYETANAVARRCALLQGSRYEEVCFVATGLNFPDALAAAPIAAAQGWPIFLAGPGGLSASTLQAMDDIGVKEAHILGGPDVVSSEVEQLLRTRLGSTHVMRHFGDTRYETAVSVAGFGVDGAGMQWDGLAIATGENFPDALCGGALQARQHSVLLLTKGATLPTAVGSSLSGERDYIARVKYLGGTDVVSSAVRGNVKARLH